MARFVRMLAVFVMAISICAILYAQDDDGGGAADTGGEAYSDADASDASDAVDTADAGDDGVEVTETSETYAEYSGPATVSTHIATAGTTYVRGTSPTVVEAAVVGGMAGAGLGTSATRTAPDAKAAEASRKAVPVRTSRDVISRAAAQAATPLQTGKLPPPQTEGGKPLMQALKERRSVREFSPEELPPQILSDLLWAASGINRPEKGGMTAPTARNMQEIDIYVVKAEGVYIYNAKEHALVPVLAGDIRSSTGEQPFVKDAPVNLVFVADYAKMERMDAESRSFCAATDTGFISENVYLYCASAGLGTVVRGWVNKPALEKAMKLRADQKVILAQTVGYPKK